VETFGSVDERVGVAWLSPPLSRNTFDRKASETDPPARLHHIHAFITTSSLQMIYPLLISQSIFVYCFLNNNYDIIAKYGAAAMKLQQSAFTTVVQNKIITV